MGFPVMNYEIIVRFFCKDIVLSLRLFLLCEHWILLKPDFSLRVLNISVKRPIMILHHILHHPSIQNNWICTDSLPACWREVVVNHSLYSYHRANTLREALQINQKGISNGYIY